MPGPATVSQRLVFISTFLRMKLCTQVGWSDNLTAYMLTHGGDDGHSQKTARATTGMPSPFLPIWSPLKFTVPSHSQKCSVKIQTGPTKPCLKMQRHLSGLNASFLAPGKGHQKEELQAAGNLPCEAQADALSLSFPSRAGRAWAPFSSGHPGTAGERGTTARAMATQTVSTQSP